jgi:gluconolactonase
VVAGDLEVFMSLNRNLAVALSLLGATFAFAQQPPPDGKTTGPGVQAPSDAKEPEVLAGCKTPPPARGGRGRGAGRGRGPAGPVEAKDVASTAIPGVIAAGQKWTQVWDTTGNNADGIIGTKDGGILLAQNNNSKVLKLKDGKTTVAYDNLNTSGALSMNSKGELFVNNRGLRANIEELAPKRQNFANTYNGDSFDCIGGVLNDLTAASNGGVYFTFGGLYYANPQGVVTKYGENLNTNGIILSRDEKTLFVTNGPRLMAFDVQPDGSLTNQREFAKWDGGGGDGSTIDSEGRIYVTTGASVDPATGAVKVPAGITVISPDGKVLGLIPSRRSFISCAFSGKNKKTLYAVEYDGANGGHDYIVTIPMLSQGFKGRAK